MGSIPAWAGLGYLGLCVSRKGSANKAVISTPSRWSDVSVGAERINHVAHRPGGRLESTSLWEWIFLFAPEGVERQFSVG